MEQFVEGLLGLENRHKLPHRNLLDLPKEILINIMEYLPASSIRNLRQTCSTLYQISHTQAIMKKLVFVIRSKYDMKNLLELLNETELRYLNLKFVNIEISQMKQILVIFLYSHGSKIDSITFDRCLMQYEILNIVMNRCFHLKKLIFNFTMMSDSKSRINSKNTNKTNKTLKVLKFHNTLNIADAEDLMISLFSFYPEIETLTFCEKHYGDNFDMAKIIVNKISICNTSIKNLKLDLQYNNCWTALLESNIRLEELSKLKICCGRENEFTLKNLETLLRRSPQLRTLKLLRIHFGIKYGRFIDTINKYGNGLKRLNYEGHINRTNTEDPLYIEERYPSFKYLKIKEFILGPSDGICFKFVANGCLTHISLHPVTLDSKEDLLKLISVSQNSLVSLKIYIDDDPINEKPVDYLISHLNIQLKKLEVLEIRILDFSWSVFISLLLNDFNFPRLRVLTLISDHCLLIEQEDLTKIVTGCPNLKELRFFCRPNERTNMLRICENIRSLEKLHVIERNCDVVNYDLRDLLFFPDREWYF